MRFSKFFLTALSCCALSAQAEGFHFGVVGAFSKLPVDTSSVASPPLIAAPESVDATLFGIKAERTMTENFAAELKIMAGTKTEIQSQFSSASLGVDYYASVTIKNSYDNNMAFSPYFLIGGAIAQVQNSTSDQAVATTLQGFTYGVGVDMKLSENNKISFEYVDLLNKDNTSMEGFSLSYGYRF